MQQQQKQLMHSLQPSQSQPSFPPSDHLRHDVPGVTGPVAVTVSAAVYPKLPGEIQSPVCAHPSLKTEPAA